jgi:peroxiredoxin family protein
MRLQIKVYDETKGKDGWTHMFITFNGISKFEEIEEAEVKITMDAGRNIKMEQKMQFAKQLQPMVSFQEEGRVQTVKYERAPTVNKLEPIQINSNLSGYDNISTLSANDSSSIGGRSIHSGQFRQLKIKGDLHDKRYYQKNHPYNYYKNHGRGEGRYQKKGLLKQSELEENQPGLYKMIIESAAKQGYHQQPLDSDVYERIAKEMSKKRQTIIVTSGDYTNVTTAGSMSSENPRSPLHDTDDTEHQPWAPDFE